jgi:predicted PurR-regulated permease PerM
VLILAATVVVLAGLRVAAPVLNPIFFAIVFSLLCSPVYAFLRRRLPNALALVLMLVGLLLISLLLFYVLGTSISRLTGRLSYYASQLNGRVTNLQDVLDLTGLSSVDHPGVVKSGKVMGALGTVLSGVAGFLSNLFLIEIREHLIRLYRGFVGWSSMYGEMDDREELERRERVVGLLDDLSKQYLPRSV